MNPLPRSQNREAQLELVERVCNSHRLAKSPRLREFLLFVTRRSIENRAAEITEIEIARGVFHRGADFIPTEDSVVRGAARQLRTKLKEYFDEEGRDEPWRIEIPKGSYVPVFHEQTAAKRETERRPMLLRASLAFNVVLAAVCLFLGATHWGLGKKAPEASLTSAFLSSAEGSVPIVVSDFSQVLLRYMAQTPFPLDAYARHDYHPVEPAPDDAYGQRLFQLLRSHHLTRSGDLSVTARMLVGAGESSRVRMRHARDITAREVRTGSVVILGNPHSTPWTALFEDQLGYQWVQGRGYRDVAGTGKEYFTTENTFHERGVGYARLACLPNFDGGGRVLLISGLNMVTMEAAGEFAADPAAWRQLREALKVRSARELPFFEAILRTDAVENTPVRARLLEARLLPR